MNVFPYALTPIMAWLFAGSIKFLINCLRARCLDFGSIGYGGMPSNHSAIVSSMATLIGLKEGVDSPAFGVTITLAFIVILDASGLRRQVGKHAIAINKISDLINRDKVYLRERMGHSLMEIFAGLLVGYMVGYIAWYFS